MNGNQWCEKYPILGFFIVIFTLIFITIGYIVDILIKKIKAELILAKGV